MIYLDNNATTRPAPAVIEAVEAMLREDWANPSSTHALGRAARARVEAARQSVARLIGAKPRDVAFTAGGTESIHLAIRGVTAIAPRTKRAIVISAVEHDAVLELCQYLEHAPDRPWELRVAPVDCHGVINLDALDAMIDDSVAIVSIQWANNETGVIQPVETIGRLCRERNVPFHCDAIQWVGKEPTDIAALPIDLLSLSAHKFHGPKGVGALWIRRGVRLQPLLHGVQERETRAGTENTPGIVGMGVAADLARQWLEDPGARTRQAVLRDQLERDIGDRLKDAIFNNSGAPRLWNTTSVSLPGADGKQLVTALSEQDIMASTGAACSSGSEEPSRVLLAMGLDEHTARATVRLSLSRETSAEEARVATSAIADAVGPDQLTDHG